MPAFVRLRVFGSLLVAVGGVTLRSSHANDVTRAVRDDAELRLWAGEELPSDVKASFSQVLANQTAGDSSKQTVQLFGLFNTGTNLVYQLLQRNFPGQIDIPEKVWKHVSLRRYFERVPEARQQFQQDGTVAIAVVRDPLSWLQSVHKAPYNLDKCTHQPSWLKDPCPFVSPVWHPPHGILFDDIEEYWNQNTEDYNHLADFGFSRSLVIRYEDVVLNTEGVVQELASLLSLKAPETLQQVDGPAKEGGACLGRQQAMEKLKSKGYLKLFHDTEMHDACERLDRSLEDQHGYEDCQEGTSVEK